MYLDAGQPLGNALPGCHDRTSFAMSAIVVKNDKLGSRAPRSESVRSLMLAPQRNDSAPDLQIRALRYMRE